MQPTRTAPGSARAGWTLLLASLAAFITCIDTMVVTTALPALRTSLHGSLADLEWTVNAYNLAFACLLLPGAALGDRFGRRRMFCLGLAGFTLASAAAALSSTVGALVAARAVQGGVAALVLPLSLTVISEAYPEARRSGAIGVWSGVIGFGGALGPVIGGAIVHGLAWQWIFWVNIPLGVVVTPLAALVLRESRGPTVRLDRVGVLLAAAGLLGLTWGLVRSSVAGWGSIDVLAPLLAGGVLLAGFTVWELHTTQPVLPLPLFRRAGFAAANAVSFFVYASLWGAVFFMAQFFQTAQHLDPLHTGLRLLMWTAPAIVVAPTVGRLVGRYGTGIFMTTGLLLHAAGLAWIAVAASPHVAYATLVAPLALSGIGIAMVMPTVSAQAVGSVPPSSVGVASGTNSTLRELGGVVGVALVSAVFARPGAYASPTQFTHGFTAALWLAAGLSLVGVMCALAPRTSRETASTELALQR